MHSANCAGCRRLHSAVVGQVIDAPVVCHDWCRGWSRQCLFRGRCPFVAVLVVDCGSGMFFCWFCWVDALRSPFVCRHARRQVRRFSVVQLRRFPTVPNCAEDWGLLSTVLGGSVLSYFFAAEVVAALVVDNGGMFIPGFCWFTLRAVFLLVADRPICSASWSVWTRRTGMLWASFAGDDATRVVFPSIGGRPKIFDIMVGLDSKAVCSDVFLDVSRLCGDVREEASMTNSS